MTSLTFLMSILSLFSLSLAGPLSYAACQSACNYGAVCCYSSVGLKFGAVTLVGAVTGPGGWITWLASAPVSTIALAAACSAAQGTCMAACTPLLVAPTP